MQYLKFVLTPWMLENDLTIQVFELLAWASGLKPLNEELPEMPVQLEEPQQESRIRKECAPSLKI